MKRGSSVVVLAASATEARALEPVCDELARRGMKTHVFDVPFVGPGNAATVWGASRSVRRLTPLGDLRIREVLRRLAPARVLLGNDDLLPSRLLIAEGRRLGIESVLVQEAATWALPNVSVSRTWRNVGSDLPRVAGHLNLYLANRRFSELGRRMEKIVRREAAELPGYGFGGADVFCVASPGDERRFRSAGCESRIVVTGIAAFISSEIAPSAHDTGPRFDAVILAPGFSKAGLATETEYRRSLADLVSGIYSSAPETRLAVKYHPNAETIESLSWLVAAFPDLSLVGGVGSAATLAAAGAILAYGSSMLLDAWFHGKKGICLVDTRLPNHAETTAVFVLAREYGSLVHIGATPDVLAAEFRDALLRSDDELNGVVRSEYELCVGNGAAARIADVVCA